MRRYLALLKSVYLIDFELPWFKNVSKQLIKSPKLFMVDSGLAADLLSLTFEKAVTDSTTMGRILENFVVNELIKQASWCNTNVLQYHYRTLTGVEVDIILEERTTGKIIGIEIKASSTIHPDDFKGLRYLQQDVGKNFVRGIVLYTGSTYLPQSKYLCALPINSLWKTESKD